MRRMHAKSSAYYELIEAMSHPGCPICQMVDRAVRQYVDAFFYENINNIARRAEIREARGYCSVHGALLAGHARALGTAILQHDVINDVLREINRALPLHPSEHATLRRPQPLDDLTSVPMRRAMLDAVKPKRMCPLCEYESDQERMLLRALVDDIDDEGLQRAFERSADPAATARGEAASPAPARANRARHPDGAEGGPGGIPGQEQRLLRS